MNFDSKYLLDGSFDPSSRIWIYQASRIFTIGEALEIEELLHDFTRQWHSHGKKVKGTAYLFFGQFVVVMADETATGVSGCSTDSSVRVMKEIEQRFRVSMFDRTTLAFVVKEKVELLPLSQLQYAFDKGFITADTLYFNNLVPSKKEFEENWIIPVKDSWLAQRITNFQSAV